MCEEITITPFKTAVKKMEDGRYLVCVTDGTCSEFTDRWEAEEHARNLERSGLTSKRWTDTPSW